MFLGVGLKLQGAQVQTVVSNTWECMVSRKGTGLVTSSSREESLV